MRAKEFVLENILDKKGKIHKDHSDTMSNTSTLPNQNMYHGSGYFHSQFMKAVAGAGAGNVENSNMGDKNWGGGDPMLSPYHPLEVEMIDRAMKHIGDNKRTTWATKSKEPYGTNVVSPVSNWNKKS